MEENNVILIDTFKAPLHNCKPVYIVFNEAAISTSKRYYFAPDKQLRELIITGVEVNFYSTLIDNFCQTLQVGGITYNVIDLVDLRNVYINFMDKDNKYVLRRFPLSGFTKLRNAELKIFELDLAIESCYIEFNTTPIVTSLPLVIPFMFFWDSPQKM